MLLGTRRVISVLCVSVVMLVAGSLLTEGRCSRAVAGNRRLRRFVHGRGLRPMLFRRRNSGLSCRNVGRSHFPRRIPRPVFVLTNASDCGGQDLRALSRLFVLEQHQ